MSDVCIQPKAILLLDGIKYRIIHTTADIISVVRMETSTLYGGQLSASKVMDSLTCGDASICSDDYSKCIDNDTSVSKEYEKRKAIILRVKAVFGPTYMGLLGKHHKPDVDKIIEEHHISRPTFWRIVRLYLQSGCSLSSLIPHNNRTYGGQTQRPGRKARNGIQNNCIITPEIEKIFAQATEFFLGSRGCTYTTVFNWMNSKFFSKPVLKEDGSVAAILLNRNERPTRRQLEHYIHTHTTKEDRGIKTTSKAEVRLDNRLLLGDSISDALGPGRLVEIDACEFDISLIGQYENINTVGRPTIYIAKDVWSKAIVAVSVGYEQNSVMGLTSLFFNLADNKNSLLKKYGIEIKYLECLDLWPSNFIPDRIRVDRGSEFIAAETERICNELHIQCDVVSGAMGSLKGDVESWFHKAQANMRPVLENRGLIEKRHDSNHHREAVFDIHSFTKLLYEFVIYYNQRYMKNYPCDKAMIDHNIQPIPIELWHYGLSVYGNPMPIANNIDFIWTLLTPAFANLTRQGISYKKLHYVNLDDRQLLDQMYVQQNKVRKIPIRFDPRDVSRIFYSHNGSVHQAILNPNLKYQQSFAELTHKEWEQYLAKRAKMEDAAIQQQDQLSADCFLMMQETAAEALAKAPATYPNTKNMSNHRAAEQQRFNHNNGIGKKLAGELDENNQVFLPSPSQIMSIEPSARVTHALPDTALETPSKKAKVSIGQNEAGVNHCTIDAFVPVDTPKHIASEEPANSDEDEMAELIEQFF